MPGLIRLPDPWRPGKILNNQLNLLIFYNFLRFWHASCNVQLDRRKPHNQGTIEIIQRSEETGVPANPR